MAKKSDSNSFLKLTEALSKVAPDGDILENSKFGKIDEWLNTGSFILNAALSGSLFGGLPNRRSLVLAGEEGCLHPNEEIEICILKNKNISQNHETRIK